VSGVKVTLLIHLLTSMSTGLDDWLPANPGLDDWLPANPELDDWLPADPAPPGAWQ